MIFYSQNADDRFLRIFICFFMDILMKKGKERRGRGKEKTGKKKAHPVRSDL